MDLQSDLVNALYLHSFAREIYPEVGVCMCHKPLC